jgi:hypothetical protein
MTGGLRRLGILLVLVSLVAVPFPLTTRAAGQVAIISPVREVQPDHIFRDASPTAFGAPPFTPQDIAKAYNFAPLYTRGVDGTGTRIAIVDAFGSSSLLKDLASFDSITGLPSATVNFYYPDGVPKLKNSNWAGETTLDVEWAHAIAPGAMVDLVVAQNATLGSVYDGIRFVSTSLPGEAALSMSFGLSESLYPTTGPFTIVATHQLFVAIASHGTTAFASSGDSGASSCCNPQYPSSDPLVVAVGGTSLFLNSDGSYSHETTWTGSGAGSSTVFSKPTWQVGLGDSMRDAVDVSYDGDPATGVLIVFGGRLFQVGGTSIGSPQWAGLIALASQANSVRYGAVSSKLYKLSSYHDITTGSDGFFSATIGWDYPTGLGTPNADSTVRALFLPSVDADVNGDGVVTSADVAIVQMLLGDGCGKPFSNVLDPHADVDHNGCVDSTDVNLVTGLLGTVAKLPDPDVTGDGKVDISDFVLEVKYLGTLLPSPDPLAPHADVDKDGKVDITDVIIIIRFLGTTFP